MAFDPDAYLTGETSKEKSKRFDPDAYLSGKSAPSSNMMTIGTSKPEEAAFASNEGGAAFGNPNIGRRKKEQPEQREITPVESAAAGVANRAFAQPAIGVTQFATGGTVGGDKAREFEKESTRYQQANPASYGAGAVGGEVLKALAPVKNIGLVKGGALYGGASGAVTPNLSENTGVDYYTDQAKNAAIGAGAGAATGGVVKGVLGLPALGIDAKKAYDVVKHGYGDSAIGTAPKETLDRAVESNLISPRRSKIIENEGLAREGMTRQAVLEDILRPYVGKDTSFLEKAMALGQDLALPILSGGTVPIPARSAMKALGPTVKHLLNKDVNLVEGAGGSLIKTNKGIAGGSLPISPAELAKTPKGTVEINPETGTTKTVSEQELKKQQWEAENKVKLAAAKLAQEAEAKAQADKLTETIPQVYGSGMQPVSPNTHPAIQAIKQRAQAALQPVAPTPTKEMPVVESTTPKLADVNIRDPQAILEMITAAKNPTKTTLPKVETPEVKPKGGMMALANMSEVDKVNEMRKNLLKTGKEHNTDLFTDEAGNPIYTEKEIKKAESQLRAYEAKGGSSKPGYWSIDAIRLRTKAAKEKNPGKADALNRQADYIEKMITLKGEGFIE